MCSASRVLLVGREYCGLVVCPGVQGGGSGGGGSNRRDRSGRSPGGGPPVQ